MNNNTSPQHARSIIAKASIASVLFIATWFIPFTHSLWLSLDKHTYLFLHNTMLQTEFLQQFWAVMNSRIVDNISHTLFILLLIRFIFAGPLETKKTRARQVLFIIVAVVGSVLMSKGIQSVVAARVSIKRDSPSIVYGHPQVALSEVLPGLDNVKDSSRRSFPSDHAMTVILLTLLIAFYTNKKYTLIATFYMVIFSLPRLISGGHWLSDTLLGSLPIATLAFTFWIAFVRNIPQFIKSKQHSK